MSENKMSRNQYRAIKAMNNEKMTEYLDKIESNAYTEGYKDGFSKGAASERPARVVEKFEKSGKDKILIKYTCPNKECGKKFQTYLNDLPNYCRQCGCKLSWTDVIEGEEEEQEEKTEQTAAAEE